MNIYLFFVSCAYHMWLSQNDAFIHLHINSYNNNSKECKYIVHIRNLYITLFNFSLWVYWNIKSASSSADVKNIACGTPLFETTRISNRIWLMSNKHWGIGRWVAILKTDFSYCSLKTFAFTWISYGVTLTRQVIITAKKELTPFLTYHAAKLFKTEYKMIR